MYIVVLDTPTTFSNGTFPDTYFLLFIDLSIPTSRFPANETPYLAPGLGPNRTTRLHWWAGNLTQTTSGTFTNSSAALAEYGGPNPPLGDIPHTYVFYLFPQPANYTPLAAALAGDFVSASAAARVNFSLLAVIEQVGNPVASNFFRTQNPNNTVNGTTTTAAGTGSSGISTASSTPSVFQGVGQMNHISTSIALVGVIETLFVTM